MNRKNKIIVTFISVIMVIVVLFLSCLVYVNDYYKADKQAVSAFAKGSTIAKEILEDETIVYKPENAQTGLIFYPGGKVECDAYLPLMEACASKGIMCLLVKMPYNLAVLRMDAAEGLQEMYPDIESWYIGGHSLGGSMASSYIKKSGDVFDGLILLGSYSTVDLSEKNIGVLSVYGSEDKVLNKDKYDECKANLPASFREKIIKGGCHAFFGMYGNQEGDGKPTISNERQIQITADIICDFVN